MVLAINALDLIGIPFGYIMDGLYRVTQNYGLAVMLFAVFISLIMHPLNMKNNINSVKKSRLEPYVRAIRQMFPGDVKVQNALMERMYEKEKVSLSGGCLMTAVPVFVLIALFSVVSRPLAYVMHLDKGVVAGIIETIQENAPELFAGGYKEIVASQYIADFKDAIIGNYSGLSDHVLNGINYNFLGLNLAEVPQMDFTKWETVDWAHIGMFILPLLPVAARLIPYTIRKIKSTYYDLKRKSNGTYVPEPKKKQYNFLMPILMLLFVIGCFQVPGVIALYWFTKSVCDMLLNVRIQKKIAALPLEYASVEDLAEEYFDNHPDARPVKSHPERDKNYQDFVARKAYESSVFEETEEPAERVALQEEYEDSIGMPDTGNVGQDTSVQNEYEESIAAEEPCKHSENMASQGNIEADPMADSGWY